MIAAREGGSWDGKLFHSPGRNIFQVPVSSLEQHNIWGQWALAGATSLCSLPPFHFPDGCAGHNGHRVVPTLAQPGPGLSRFGSRRHQHWCRDLGLDLKLTDLERDFTWTCPAQFTVNLESRQVPDLKSISHHQLEVSKITLKNCWYSKITR